MAEDKSKLLQRRLFDDRISLTDENGNIQKELTEEEAKKELNEKTDKHKIVKRNTKGSSEEL